LWRRKINKIAKIRKFVTVNYMKSKAIEKQNNGSSKQLSSLFGLVDIDGKNKQLCVFRNQHCAAIDKLGLVSFNQQLFAACQQPC